MFQEALDTFLKSADYRRCAKAHQRTRAQVVQLRANGDYSVRLASDPVPPGVAVIPFGSPEEMRGQVVQVGRGLVATIPASPEDLATELQQGGFTHVRYVPQRTTFIRKRLYSLPPTIVVRAGIEDVELEWDWEHMTQDHIPVILALLLYRQLAQAWYREQVQLGRIPQPSVRGWIVARDGDDWDDDIVIGGDEGFLGYAW